MSLTDHDTDAGTGWVVETKMSKKAGEGKKKDEEWEPNTLSS